MFVYMGGGRGCGREGNELKYSFIGNMLATHSSIKMEFQET